MKKYLLFIALFTLGLLCGGLLFYPTTKQEKRNKQDPVSEVNQMWTCSMHPQIMLPEPGACPICGMDLILAGNNEDGLSVNQFKLTNNAMALANVQTSIVGHGDMDSTFIKLSGKIVENEATKAVQVSYFSEGLNV